MAIIIVSIVGAMNFNVSLSSNRLQLKNIEALANGEDHSGRHTCYDVLEGNNGNSVLCRDCGLHTGTPPWFAKASSCI